VLSSGVTLTDGFGVHNVAGEGEGEGIGAGLFGFRRKKLILRGFYVPTELQLKISVF
jgi:hypothetical protein